MNKRHCIFFNHILLLLAFAFINLTAQAQTTAFTYQGKLSESNAAANGVYEMQFRLFDNQNAGQGMQQGATVTKSNVQVTNGIFTVLLDFNSQVFATGAIVYLEISIRPFGSGGGYTSLAPRQFISSAPYAIKALNASGASLSIDSLNLGGVPANQFVQTNDSRLVNYRPPIAGSEYYIQNSAAPQIAEFNVAGNGTAANLTAVGTLSGNAVNSATQYKINGEKIISVAGIENLFVGFLAGTNNTNGSGNSFFGLFAGNANTTGANNVFFGGNAGQANTTGQSNAFFGRSAGVSNVVGINNSFFGAGAGALNNGGDYNTFVGSAAGATNVSGNNNTLIGRNADVAGGNLSNATAIGANALVSTSNTMVLGTSAVNVVTPGTLQINTLGTTGGTPLCRNGQYRISACAANLSENNTQNSKDNRIDAILRIVKDQQMQIERQQLVIDDLKKLVCSQNQQAAVCE